MLENKINRELCQKESKIDSKNTNYVQINLVLLEKISSDSAKKIHHHIIEKILLDIEHGQTSNSAGEIQLSIKKRLQHGKDSFDSYDISALFDMKDARNLVKNIKDKHNNKDKFFTRHIIDQEFYDWSINVPIKEVANFPPKTDRLPFSRSHMLRTMGKKHLQKNIYGNETIDITELSECLSELIQDTVIMKNWPTLNDLAKIKNLEIKAMRDWVRFGIINGHQIVNKKSFYYIHPREFARLQNIHDSYETASILGVDELFIRRGFHLGSIKAKKYGRHHIIFNTNELDELKKNPLMDKLREYIPLTRAAQILSEYFGIEYATIYGSFEQDKISGEKIFDTIAVPQTEITRIKKENPFKLAQKLTANRKIINNNPDKFLSINQAAILLNTTPGALTAQYYGGKYEFFPTQNEMYISLEDFNNIKQKIEEQQKLEIYYKKNPEEFMQFKKKHITLDELSLLIGVKAKTIEKYNKTNRITMEVIKIGKEKYFSQKEIEPIIINRDKLFPHQLNRDKKRINFIKNKKLNGNIENDLTKEDETFLLQQCKLNNGNAKSAKEILYLRHEKLIKSIACKFNAHSFDFEDMVNYGTLGFLEAIERVNLHQASSFPGLAYCCIKARIIEKIRDLDKLIHIPRKVIEKMKVIKHKVAQVDNNNSQKEAILKDNNSNKVEFIHYQNTSSRQASLDKINNQEITLMEILKDENNDYEHLENKLTITDIMNNSGLTAEDKELIKLYYGLNGSKAMSFPQISKLLNISTECLKGRKWRAMEKIRNSIIGRELIGSC